MGSYNGSSGVSSLGSLSVKSLEFFGVVANDLSKATSNSFNMEIALAAAKSSNYVLEAKIATYYFDGNNISGKHVIDGVLVRCPKKPQNWSQGNVGSDGVGAEDATCTFVMVGTGPKVYTTYHITNLEPYGGLITNHEAGIAPSSEPCPTYQFLDLTNKNATTSTPATSKTFSVAFEKINGGELENIRIRNQMTGGITGFSNRTLLNLGSEWDMGLMDNGSDNNGFAQCKNIQVVGYWRLAGLFNYYNDIQGSRQASNEFNYYENCIFSGHRGVVLRGSDLLLVSGTTSNTVSTPWYAGIQIPTTGGQFRLYDGTGTDGVVFTHTGASKVGNDLVITGVSPNPITNGFNAGSSMRTHHSALGFAGTKFRNCTFTGLEHGSGVIAQNTLLGSLGPSVAFEAHNASRIYLVGGRLITREENQFLLGSVADLLLTEGFYQEQKPYSINQSGSITAMPAGGRFITFDQTYPNIMATGEIRITDGCTDTSSGISSGPIYPNTTTKFTGPTFIVDATTNILTTASNHGRTTGSRVRVAAINGGVIPLGTLSYEDYFARSLSSTTLTLHPTATDAVINTNIIDITSVGHVVSGGTGSNTVVVSAGHGRSDFDAVKFITISGSMITPLVSDTTYYIRATSSTNMAIYPTLLDAQNDTNRITITSSGSGSVNNLLTPSWLTTAGYNRGTKVRNKIYEEPFVTGKRVQRIPNGFVAEYQGQGKTPILTIEQTATPLDGFVFDSGRLSKTSGSFIFRGPAGERFRFQENPSSDLMVLGSLTASVQNSGRIQGIRVGDTDNVMQGFKPVNTYTVSSGTINPNGNVVGSIGDSYTNTTTGKTWNKETGNITNSGWLIVTTS